MDENKNKFEIPDLDELEKTLDTPLESPNDKLPYDNNSGKPADDPIINPSFAVGPNGESSSPQNADYMPQIPQYDGPEPGRQLSMTGMILGIISIVLALICNLFAGVTVVANTIDTIAILCGIAGIVLGVMGGNQNASYGAPRGGMSIAGIVCGIMGILLGGVSLACIGCVGFVRDTFFTWH